MTTAEAVNTNVEDQYDPDSPPEDRGFLGTLTIAANVNPATNTVFPSYGPETDARVITATKQYTENPKVNYQYEVLFLEAEGVDVTRSDGAPFRQHDIIKTRSAKGANLGANQTPALFATSYRDDHGVSISPLKVGTPGSAVGRTFQFATHEYKLGKDFKKGVKLFPKELMPEDFVYDGEVRVVTIKATEDAGAAIDGGASSAPSEPEVIEILKEIFAGRKPADMMDIVLANGARLGSVATVYGVPLLESATDESLATVLQEHRVMAINGAGVFVII